MKTCAHPSCLNKFHPTNNRQIFCPNHSNSPGVKKQEELDDLLEDFEGEPMDRNPDDVEGLLQDAEKKLSEKSDKYSGMADIINSIIGDRVHEIVDISIRLRSGVSISVKGGI